MEEGSNKDSELGEDMEDLRGAKAVQSILMVDDTKEELTEENENRLGKYEDIQVAIKHKFTTVASLSVDDDESDGRSESINEFVQKYQENPKSLSSICKPETNETIIHILAKEGRLDILRMICEENKTSNKTDLNENLLIALKTKDNFNQAPVLASFNAHNEDKEKETTTKYLLDKIFEYDDDMLTYGTLSQRNKTNDSVLTELFRNKDIYAKAIKVYFNIFTRHNEKKRSHSRGFYHLILQMIEENSLKLNSSLMGQIIYEIKEASRNFLKVICRTE